MRIPAALVLLGLALPLAQAQTYKCRDERGRWQFSDKPIPGCVGATQILAPPPAPPPRKGAQAAAAQRTAKKAPPTDHEKAQYVAECRASREQLEWLLGPRGQGVENRETRVAQLKDALNGCP